MINDQLIMQAVSKILQRSERQADLQDPRNAIAYIDARTLGSTAQFSDPQVPLRQRCLALFRDILTAVHTALLEQIIEHPSSRAEEALALSDQLLSSIVDPVQTYRAESLTTSFAAGKTSNSSTGIELVPSSLGARFSLQTEQHQERQASSSFAVETDDKVVFPTLHSLLSQILEFSCLDLYVLLDEWSSIPQDIQPYLAEFLKRGVLPVSSCVLKIASLEYRSHFNTRRNGGEFLGFELGADISTAQDLDDYYVFDRNPEQVTTVYADMLLRHLAIELPENYLSDSYRITTGDQLASKLFTERATTTNAALAESF